MTWFTKIICSRRTVPAYPYGCWTGGRAKLPNQQSAFTLFEMLVVLGVLTVMTGLSTAYIQLGDGSRELRLAANRLVGDLRKARNEARMRNADIFVNFSHRSYTIHQLGIERQIPLKTRISLQMPVGSVIRFSPFELGSGALIVLRAERRVHEVRVDPLTERIHAVSHS